METKKVKLPSGLDVEIKKLGILGFQKVYGFLPDVTVDTSEMTKSQGLKQEHIGLSVEVVCSCSVAPRFSTESPPPDGFVCVDELDLGDFFALTKEINGFSGMEDGSALVPLSVTNEA